MFCFGDRRARPEAFVIAVRAPTPVERALEVADGRLRHGLAMPRSCPKQRLWHRRACPATCWLSARTPGRPRPSPPHPTHLMASVRSFTLPHYDAYPVHIALFHDVRNAAFLRSQLLAANPDFDYAFLDATMVSRSAAYWLTLLWPALGPVQAAIQSMVGLPYMQPACYPGRFVACLFPSLRLLHPCCA